VPATASARAPAGEPWPCHRAPRATAGVAQELATGIGHLLARRHLSPQQGEGRWRQGGREMEAGRRRVMVRAGRRGLPGWPVGWWEGVFGKPPRGGFCKKYRIINFSLLHVEIKFRMRVYL